ncbi:MAG: 4'-phosphopantetheinyl transferase family protein, partial [Acutalibacteraceae bacterium]
MKIYYSYIGDFDESFFENADVFLPKEKREKISEYKNLRAKKESILGWYLFSCGCREFHVQNRKLRFGENGKPGFENEPIFFNISHTDGFVCCAFSEFPVGIDAEKVHDFKFSVAERVLCQNELEVLKKSRNQPKTFIRLWTLKESFLKQNGKGIAAGLKALDFSDYIEKKAFRFETLAFRCDEIEDYLISICSFDDKVEFIRI